MQQNPQILLSTIQQAFNGIAQGTQETSARVAQLMAEINEINNKMAYQAPTAQDMVTLQVKNQELVQARLLYAQLQSVRDSLSGRIEPFSKALNNAQANLASVVKSQAQEAEAREAANGPRGVVITHQTTVTPI